MAFRLTRRAVLAGLGLAPLSGCLVTGNPPMPITRIRSIRLDVGPLAEKGLPTWSAKVAAIGRPLVDAAFADILAPKDPKAPDVVLTVETITLVGNPPSYDGPREMAPQDTIAGRLLVPAGSGLPAFDRRMSAHVPPADAGPWYLPDIDDRRLAALLGRYALWARRDFAA